jgi:hypothetical protein
MTKPNRGPTGAQQARMAKVIHRLPEVSPGLAMPDPSVPCRRATLETALQPFLGGQPAVFSYPLGVPRRTPMGPTQRYLALWHKLICLILFVEFINRSN